MKCPYCGSSKSRVLDKRNTENDSVIRRRRVCLSCQKRYTTYERIEVINLTVIKKDGRREQFDRTKLERGLLKACEKRMVPREKIKQICDDIEIRLLNKKSTEIPSKTIGNMVMRRLKKIDQVAYVRFASVYKDFKDVESFQKELAALLKKGGN
ncbi:transcriptional repressor NrdR [Candidatus Woesearchaeota archaeon]|nr:transcriptional repressor NrdR [Candidatus Woesearchaeota archaeon]